MATGTAIPRALPSCFAMLDNGGGVNPGPPAAKAIVERFWAQRENLLRGDTIQARNAAKTHCVNGHPFDEANTYRRRGRRLCRTCIRERRAAA